MSRRALIVWGGWDGHQPKEVGELFADMLRAEQFEVEISDTLETFRDEALVQSLSLIVPVWTMGTAPDGVLNGVYHAVNELGVGLAGCHGGMCDAFRNECEWQFMTGGQWVAHPGNDGVTYTVEIDRTVPHEITDGIPDFEVVSEQYYLHTDPGNLVLASTRFPNPHVSGPHRANPCQMPQVWVKTYGAGRVFYNALGHQRNVLEAPEPRELMRRGFLWAAK